MSTVPDPMGQPDAEHPNDPAATPDRDRPGPAPTPEHHPDRVGRPGDDIGNPPPTITPAD